MGQSFQVSNQLISLTSREPEKIGSHVPSKTPVSNQLISLTSREDVEEAIRFLDSEWLTVSNQLISLTSRETSGSGAYRLTQKRFQSINFPNE